METYRRMIIEDLDDGFDYVVLKPNGDDFHRVGRHYKRRGLFNYLKDVESQKKRGIIDRYCFLLDPSLAKDAIRNFNDIGELVEILDLGVKVES